MTGQPAIVAIGIQEFVPLNASNIAAGSTGGSSALLAAMKGEEADKAGADIERIRRTEDNILHILGRDKCACARAAVKKCDSLMVCKM